MAYAICSGLGMALITLMGIWYFKEPASVMKIGSIALINVGIVGLNLSSG